MVVGVIIHWYRLIRQKRNDIVSADMYLTGLILAAWFSNIIILTLSLVLIAAAALISRAKIRPLLTGLGAILEGRFAGQQIGCLLLLAGGIVLTIATSLRLVEFAVMTLGIVVLAYLMLSLSEPQRVATGSLPMGTRESVRSS